MESPSVKVERTSSADHDLTVELPVVKAMARKKVDILLPSSNSDWRGPALQENDANAPPKSLLADDLDSSIAPAGMLRPVDTTFSETKTQRPRPSLLEKGSDRYARRSTVLGRLYTVFFIVSLSAGAAYLYMNHESFLATIISNFN